ncbi:VUT family protein [Rubellimicrobium roseum]|uniref:VUT family protein n=1 Tax=Rubellimicrobium roseum TaxID=687525 RepID=A0A5C4NHV9_9RHOB|nr:VUT family protein [Rubellimicrobium roseum]TNC74351.1 VUT family protein [Rubellimicrobium roseum]
MSDLNRTRRNEGFAFFAAFAATVPLANWLIGNVGTFCAPQGPCVIPVGFGFEAPSGVLAVGAALVLRDLVQRRLGLGWSMVAILVGAALSATFASRELVIASTAAFLLSELADLAIYTPLQRRRLMLAVLISGVVGLTVDSIVFLWLAFGSLDFVAGQVLGKLWMVLITLPLLAWLRQRDARLGLSPA